MADAKTSLSPEILSPEWQPRESSSLRNSPCSLRLSMTMTHGSGFVRAAFRSKVRASGHQEECG
jgi:hypothetical protein